MISLDPLYFLLIVEGLLLQTVGLTLLYWKWQKTKRNYLDAFGRIPETKVEEPVSLTEEKGVEEETLLVVQEEPSGPSPLELGEIKPEIENLKMLVAEKSEIILQMKKKIEAMEKKFEDMENEYLILFDQSQKQEQALKAAGLSLDKDVGDF
jgi:uncharacterized coiled-coil protein SlyX